MCRCLILNLSYWGFEMTKKKIKDGDIIITCDKKPACYEYIARLEMLRKYRKLDKEHETAITQYNAVVVQNKDLQKELNQCKRSMVYKINRRLIKEKADALAETLELKYILKQIWNIVEHQINFNANNTDKTYTVNDLKKIQQKIREVVPA